LEPLGRLIQVRTDDDARVALSLGKSYPDLYAARTRELDQVCDAVVTPASEDELATIVSWLAEQDVAGVPVGGGTSVVGGIEALGRSAEQPVVAIDLSALAACIDVDAASSTATFQAGITGPELEEVLRRYHLTLGHVPQSFQRSTLGGWIAARSAGQQSLYFGKIERMVAALDMHAPAGKVSIDHLPAHGAGPDALELICGSEGTCGVISRATMRVQERPEVVGFSSWIFPNFAQATAAARKLVQHGLRPATVRVSDPAETAFTLSSSAPSYLPRWLARRAAGMLRLDDPSMVFVVMPSAKATLQRLERHVTAHMRSCGGTSMGSMPARKWYQARFIQPFVRDRLMDRGLLVDTLETAAPWHAVAGVHRDISQALTASLGPRAVVGCHLSHLYRDGCSLYFTFIADVEAGRHLPVWHEAKRAVERAIAQNRAATSHQHGVGTMHAALFRERTNPIVLEALQHARSAFDPKGIMNPGKLVELPHARDRSLNTVTV
jgi:alkyldihydroxyacetonephosphate synthase